MIKKEIYENTKITKEIHEYTKVNTVNILPHRQQILYQMQKSLLVDKKFTMAVDAFAAEDIEGRVRKMVPPLSKLFNLIKQRRSRDTGLESQRPLNFNNIAKNAITSLDDLKKMALQFELSGINTQFSQFIIDYVLVPDKSSKRFTNVLKIEYTKKDIEIMSSTLADIGLSAKEAQIVTDKMLKPRESNWNVLDPVEPTNVDHDLWRVDNFIGAGSGGGGGSGGGAGSGGGIIFIPPICKGMGNLFFTISNLIQDITTYTTIEEEMYGLGGAPESPIVSFTTQRRGTRGRSGIDAKRHAGADLFNDLGDLGVAGALIFGIVAAATGGASLGVCAVLSGFFSWLNYEAENSIRPDSSNPFGGSDASTNFVDP